MSCALHENWSIAHARNKENGLLAPLVRWESVFVCFYVSLSFCCVFPCASFYTAAFNAMEPSEIAVD